MSAQEPDSPHELVERALELSRTDGCIVIADQKSAANLRWASNSLTTNGATRGRTLIVVATLDGRDGTATGVVSRNAVTRDDLEELVRAAETAARAAGPAEDTQPLLPPSGPASTDFAEAPAETTADVFTAFAPALGEAFARAHKSGRLLYGFANHTVTSTYLGTSTGIRLRHDQPNGTLELNTKTADLTASAWTGTATRDFRDVDLGALQTQLGQRLAWAERKVDLPPGRYETLLPPSALADLMTWLRGWLSDRYPHQDGTVFSRTGGKTHIGERLAHLPLTLYSDPAHPGMEKAPFVIARSPGSNGSVFDNGLPLTRTDWIRDGKLTNLITSRHSAALTGLPVRPFAGNLVLEGPQPQASATLEEMVTRTRRGLLLGSLWYLNEDDAPLLLSGRTRDGVYLVENGEVTGAVNNFRFNESPVDLLGRITETGRTEHCLTRDLIGYQRIPTAMPPVRIPDFHMSSTSPV